MPETLPIPLAAYLTAAKRDLDRLRGLAETLVSGPSPTKTAENPAPIVLPTVDEVAEVIRREALRSGFYADYARAVLDFIAGRVTPWKPVAPGTVIKSGTRYRFETADGESTEGTYSLDLTATREGVWFIDPRTVPEPEDPGLEVLAEELEAAADCCVKVWPCSDADRWRKHARELLTRIDAARADR